MHDVVKEDTVSRAAKMSRLFLFKTSAANDIATAAGGCEMDCWVRQLGIFFKEAHVQHVWEHWSRVLSRSIAQKERRTTCFNWCWERWFSLICSAVSRSSIMDRGMTMHSREGQMARLSLRLLNRTWRFRQR